MNTPLDRQCVPVTRRTGSWLFWGCQTQPDAERRTPGTAGRMRAAPDSDRPPQAGRQTECDNTGGTGGAFTAQDTQGVSGQGE